MAEPMPPNPFLKRAAQATPDEERIFPGGPTKAQIAEWKAKYGRLYATNFGTEDNPEIYIWRTLSRLEFKELARSSNKADGMWKEERLVEKCVLWPPISGPNLNMLKAGIPTVLADQIMERSGFVPSGEPVDIDDLLGVPEGLASGEEGLFDEDADTSALG